MRLLVRWVILACALFVAAWLIPGIRVEGDAWVVYAATAVIVGFVNAVVRPVLRLLALPITLLTLGMFALVVNGISLWLASAIAVRWFGVGFHIEGFWPAFWGALVVSGVTLVLSKLLVGRE